MAKRAYEKHIYADKEEIRDVVNYVLKKHNISARKLSFLLGHAHSYITYVMHYSMLQEHWELLLNEIDELDRTLDQ